MDEAAQTQRIVAAMLERTICLACLAADVDMPDPEVARLLEKIAGGLRFDAQASGYCQICEQITGPVYWMRGPTNDADPPGRPLF